MAQDHQLTFDWILYVILVPPALGAAWELFRTRKQSREARIFLSKAHDRAEADLVRKGAKHRG